MSSAWRPMTATCSCSAMTCSASDEVCLEQSSRRVVQCLRCEAAHLGQPRAQARQLLVIGGAHRHKVPGAVAFQTCLLAIYPAELTGSIGRCRSAAGASTGTTG